MLKHLYIKNYALISELELDLRKGFSVITGETGAGKSILLGAIGLLQGETFRGENNEGCIVEADFDIEGFHLKEFFDENELEWNDSECTIRRQISSTGKSRAFVNDTPVNLSILKQLGNKLIDIHSQHQNLLLGKEDFQLNVLDILAQDQAELDQYHILFNAWKDATSQLKEKQEETEKNQADLEYLTYQVEQLRELNPKAHEDEELEEECRILSHTEEIKSQLFEASETLSGETGNVVERVRHTMQVVSELSKIYNDVKEMSERLDSAYIELRDISDEIEKKFENIEADPQRLQQIEERLDLIYTMEQKFHVSTTAELLTLKENLEEKLEHISHADEDLNALEEIVEKAFNDVEKQAKKLTEIRQKSAQKLEQEMAKRLIPLGITNAQFKIDIKNLSTPTEKGKDAVTYLFCANKNAHLQAIAQVASGGEIARIMLSLKALVSKNILQPTLIFDEIDTGVSGRIAECMGQTMKEMSEEGQIISITHLPQIAAKGENHYRVYKEDTQTHTHTHIEELDAEQRVMEIAHMLSGANVSKAAIENAKQLLKL